MGVRDHMQILREDLTDDELRHLSVHQLERGLALGEQRERDRGVASVDRILFSLAAGAATGRLVAVVGAD